VPENAAAAVARQQANRPNIATVIAQLKPEIQRALPKGMDADRIARLALTAIRKDRNLAQCSPESFAGALLTSAALGLEPNLNGEAYLVAYKGECTLIVGYMGYAKLFFQHPLARHLDAQAVHAQDDFDYAYGLDPYLRHKPARGDRGPITDYYAVAALSTGAKLFVVLSVDEVKALRGPVRAGSIADPQHWMERKTALRQLLKLLPKSTTLQRAMDADEKRGLELYQDRMVENTPPPAALEQGTGERVVVPPDGGPAYNPQTGEAVTVDVLDPPYDPADEPPSWRDQGGAQ
jgi:recombination protein RecT